MRTLNRGNEYWKLHADGALELPGLVSPNAKTWRVVSAVERNNFGQVVRQYTLQDILTLVIPWRFKNGKQRTFIRDMDHGSLREWTSPTHFVV